MPPDLPGRHRHEGQKVGGYSMNGYPSSFQALVPPSITFTFMNPLSATFSA